MSLIKIGSVEQYKQEVIDSPELVVVDFWSPACGPCRVISPMLEKLANQGIKVAKINTDEQMELAVEYRVTSIPTVLIIRQGTEVWRKIGIMQEGELLEAIKNSTPKLWKVNRLRLERPVTGSWTTVELETPMDFDFADAWAASQMPGWEVVSGHFETSK